MVPFISHSGLNKQWGKILGDAVNLKIINFPRSTNALVV